MKERKITTSWRTINDLERMRVSYGWSFCKGQAPHFGVTAEIRPKDRRRGGESFGCLHSEVIRHFPELAHLVKWHLVSTQAPLHYEANGVFWWKLRDVEIEALANFRDSVVFGALGMDECSFLVVANEPYKATRDEYLADWMAERLPFLMELMREECEAAGVPAPDERESFRWEHWYDIEKRAAHVAGCG